MIARLHPRSLLVSMFFALAAALAAVGLAACGKSEEKPAPPSAPASTTPSSKAPKSPAGVPGTTPASTAIGRIDALDGDVRIVGATAERRAQTGTEIREGDTVKVGADSWALLGMSDGASVTMRPDSELRFNQYRYAPDGEANQNSAVMLLVKGAFRSITGYIGQTNRSGYQIQTRTATIGIRGTDHEPAYYPPPAPGEKSGHAPGTYDKVNAGESVIRRPTGEVSVKRGQTAFAHHDVKIRPRLLPTPPAFYQQHAQVDRKVAVRRTEFHRQFDQRQQRLQQERKQQQQTLKRELEQRKDKKQLEQQKGKKQPDHKGKQPEAKDKKQARQQDKKQQDQKGKPSGQQDRKQAGQQDKKQAEQKGRKPPDQKKQPEPKAKDEKKAALPPSVAERIKTMQRGDKNTSPTPRQSPPQQPQRPQPQQQQKQQPQPQKQQPQQQNPRQQAHQLRDQAKKKPEPK